jgi:hypothetical protein
MYQYNECLPQLQELTQETDARQKRGSHYGLGLSLARATQLDFPHFRFAT